MIHISKLSDLLIIFSQGDDILVGNLHIICTNYNNVVFTIYIDNNNNKDWQYKYMYNNNIIDIGINYNNYK